MNETLVASIRKNLESKSTEELRKNYEGHAINPKSPEELEALRQNLDDRGRKGTRVMLALASALVFGSLGAGYAWWQFGPGVAVFLAGVGGAVLGFASWYIRDLIPSARL